MPGWVGSRRTDSAGPICSPGPGVGCVSETNRSLMPKRAGWHGEDAIRTRTTQNVGAAVSFCSVSLHFYGHGYSAITAPFLYNPRKIPNSLIKLRARVRANKEFENTSQWQRDPNNTIPQWSRTPKCDPKTFSILVFFSSVGNFLNRILTFDPPVKKKFFGSGF